MLLELTELLLPFAGFGLYALFFLLKLFFLLLDEILFALESFGHLFEHFLLTLKFFAELLFTFRCLANFLIESLVLALGLDKVHLLFILLSILLGLRHLPSPLAESALGLFVLSILLDIALLKPVQQFRLCGQCSREIGYFAFDTELFAEHIL